MYKGIFLLSVFILSGVATYLGLVVETETTLSIILLTMSSLMTLQGLITLAWMLYAWENPDSIKKRKSPDNFASPQFSFTALLPVRHEDKVIYDTINAIDSIEYPDHLKEILVIVRHDDKKTIEKAQKAISNLKKDNISLIVMGETFPINKPKSLNTGFTEANNDIVAIFDAEDEPSTHIYNIINTVMLSKKADVVQSGVQLMNYNSNWFSTLNVLEYFLWFKSGLHFFTDKFNVSLLGGNTVFFKREFLQKVGGWDEKSLTEDADVGLKLSAAGARISVIYDERHVTKEETPSTVDDFIKQRTRWNNGFLQILAKGEWLSIRGMKQKLAALYLLSVPFFPVFLIFYIPFGVVTGIAYPTSVPLAMITYIPFYIMLMIITLQIVALWEFTRAYGQKFRLGLPLKIIFTFLPYVSLLTISAIRAIWHFILGNSSWEKTTHLNLHRFRIDPVYENNRR